MKLSSAKVNWEKCEAFLAGRELGREDASYFAWEFNVGKDRLESSCGMSTEGFGVMDKPCARSSKWKCLLPPLFYRGPTNVLTTNNLVASVLWHKLIILCPPINLLERIQQKILDFSWSSKHWICGSAHFLLVAEGGQGLVDIFSMMAAFRQLRDFFIIVV